MGRQLYSSQVHHTIYAWQSFPEDWCTNWIKLIPPGIRQDSQGAFPIYRFSKSIQVIIFLRVRKTSTNSFIHRESPKTIEHHRTHQHPPSPLKETTLPLQHLPPVPKTPKTPKDPKNLRDGINQILRVDGLCWRKFLCFRSQLSGGNMVGTSDLKPLWRCFGFQIFQLSVANFKGRFPTFWGWFEHLGGVSPVSLRSFARSSFRIGRRMGPQNPRLDWIWH